MQTFHFTQLREFAVRDKIERGRVYIYCHPLIGFHYRDWIPMDEEEERMGWRRPYSDAYVVIAGSGLIQRSRRDTCFVAPTAFDNPFWEEKAWGWYSISPSNGRRRWQFASDSGVLNGRRNGNFVLDRAALLKEGIVVDLSMFYPFDMRESAFYDSASEDGDITINGATMVAGLDF